MKLYSLHVNPQAFSTVLVSLLMACTHVPMGAPASNTIAKNATPGVVATAPGPLSTETPITTPAGVTFTAPSGWTVTREATRLTLQQGSDLAVVVVDPQATTAEAALTAAWQTFRPGWNRPIEFAQTQPGRDGWDEIRTHYYGTSPNERLTLFATALRKDNAWTVFLIEGADAAYERRGAQVGLMRQSLRPPGYQQETFAGKKAHPLDEARIQQLVTFVETARQQAGIPGVAIALVQGDRVVYSGGFGVRALGSAEPVDAQTLFMIASNTKPLSTLLLAKLIDEGRFAWETPVTSVLPDFFLGDAETTAKVQMKHLVCACTGLPRQDLEWLFEFRTATAATELKLLGTMKPTTAFGETFQYSNLLASAAGFAGAHAAFPALELGAAYDEAMRTRIFAPLGMNSTTFDYALALRSNHATPHSEQVDGINAVAAMDVNHAIVPLRPAGGAWSNVTDLAKYVQLELAQGKLPGGASFISAETLLARRIPQVAAGADATYGMGLFVENKFGTPIIHHGGSMIGFKSDMFWLPEHGLGAVILTNADAGTLLLRPLIRRVLEVVFDGKPEAAEDVVSAVARRKAMFATSRERLVIPADPMVVAGLRPRYSNPALGELTVKPSPQGTTFDMEEWRSQVASRKNDDGSMSLITIDPGVSGFEFVVDTRADKPVLVIRDMQHEYVFVAKE